MVNTNRIIKPKRLIAKISWQLEIISRTRFTKEFRTLMRRILMILVVVSVVVILEGIAYSYFYEGSESYNPDFADSVYFVLVNVFQ